MMTPEHVPPPPILSPESLAKLAELLQAAQLETCRNEECDCITWEEHEHNLALALAHK